MQLDAAPAIGAGALLRDVRQGPVPPRMARRDQLVELRALALAMAHDDALLQPAAAWRFATLQSPPDADGTLWLDGVALQVPRLLPARGRLCALACAVLTLGERLEQRVRELFAERRAALAVTLDAVGNELLFALSRRVQDDMLRAASRKGLQIAGELRAGDPGLPLQAQARVLQLAGAERVGVTLTSTLMMQPAKSASLVQGVGHDLPAADWSRCDDCRSRARCALSNGSTP